MLMGSSVFGDQPEAADLGRNCEICRVELELDRPWCQNCTLGEINPLGKVGEIADKLGRKDCDVNTDGLVRDRICDSSIAPPFFHHQPAQEQ